MFLVLLGIYYAHRAQSLLWSKSHGNERSNLMLPSLKNDLFINISFCWYRLQILKLAILNLEWDHQVAGNVLWFNIFMTSSPNDMPSRLVWVVRKEVSISLNRVVVQGGSCSRNTNLQGELLLGAESGLFWSWKNHDYKLQHTSLKVLFEKLIDTSKFSWRK
jgi:hypothetical protein